MRFVVQTTNHNSILETQVEQLDPSIFSILTIHLEKMGEFVIEINVMYEDIFF